MPDRRLLCAGLVLTILCGTLCCYNIFIMPEPATISVYKHTVAEPVQLSPHVMEEGFSVDLNSTDLDILQQLPGIGPKRAQDILDYAAQNGPYRTVDDLLNVPGIGASILEALRPFLTVG